MTADHTGRLAPTEVDLHVRMDSYSANIKISDYINAVIHLRPISLANLEEAQADVHHDARHSHQQYNRSRIFGPQFRVQHNQRPEETTGIMRS